MNLMNLEINPSSLGKRLILIDVRPVYQYSDGKKLDIVTGYKYQIVMPERQFDKIEVKIEGPIQHLQAPEEPVEVEFDGLSLSLYTLNGVYNLAARAQSVRIATKK